MTADILQFRRRNEPLPPDPPVQPEPKTLSDQEALAYILLKAQLLRWAEQHRV